MSNNSEDSGDYTWVPQINQNSTQNSGTGTHSPILECEFFIKNLLPFIHQPDEVFCLRLVSKKCSEVFTSVVGSFFAGDLKKHRQEIQKKAPEGIDAGDFQSAQSRLSWGCLTAVITDFANICELHDILFREFAARHYIQPIRDDGKVDAEPIPISSFIHAPPFERLLHTLRFIDSTKFHESEDHQHGFVLGLFSAEVNELFLCIGLYRAFQVDLGNEALDFIVCRQEMYASVYFEDLKCAAKTPHRFYSEFVRKNEINSYNYIRFKKSDLYGKGDEQKDDEDLRKKLASLVLYFRSSSLLLPEPFIDFLSQLKNKVYLFSKDVIDHFENSRVDRLSNEIKKLQAKLEEVNNSFSSRLQKYVSRIDELSRSVQQYEEKEQDRTTIVPTSTTKKTGRKRRRWGPGALAQYKLVDSDSSLKRESKLNAQRAKMRKTLKLIVKALEEFMQEDDLALDIIANFPELNKNLVGSLSIGREGKPMVSVYQDNVVSFQVSSPEEAVVMLMNSKGPVNGFYEMLNKFPKVSKKQFQVFISTLTTWMANQCFYVGDDDTFFGIVKDYYCSAVESVSDPVAAVNCYKFLLKAGKNQRKLNKVFGRELVFASKVSDAQERDISFQGKSVRMKGFDCTMPYFLFSDALNAILGGRTSTIGIKKLLFEFGKLYVPNPKTLDTLSILRVLLFKRKEFGYQQNFKFLRRLKALEANLESRNVCVVIQGQDLNEKLKLEVFFLNFSFVCERVPDWAEIMANIYTEKRNCLYLRRFDWKYRHYGLFSHELGHPECSFLPRANSFTYTYQLFYYLKFGQWVHMGFQQRSPHELDIFNTSKISLCRLHFLFIFAQILILIVCGYIAGSAFALSGVKNWKELYSKFIFDLQKDNILKKGCSGVENGKFFFVEVDSGRDDESQKSDYFMNKFTSAFSSRDNSYVKQLASLISMIVNVEVKNDLEELLQITIDRLQDFKVLKAKCLQLEFFEFWRDMVPTVMALDKVVHFVQSFKIVLSPDDYKEFPILKTCNFYFHLAPDDFNPRMIKFQRHVDLRNDAGERANSSGKHHWDDKFCYATKRWPKVCLPGLNGTEDRFLDTTMLNALHIIMVYWNLSLKKKNTIMNLHRMTFAEDASQSNCDSDIMNLDRSEVSMSGWKPTKFDHVFEEHFQQRLDEIFLDRKRGFDMVSKLKYISIIVDQKIKGGSPLLLNDSVLSRGPGTDGDVFLTGDTLDILNDLINSGQISQRLALVQTGGINSVLENFRDGSCGAMIGLGCSCGKGSIKDITYKIMRDNQLITRMFFVAPGNPVQEFLKETVQNDVIMDTIPLRIHTLNQIDLWLGEGGDTLVTNYASLEQFQTDKDLKTKLQNRKYEFLLVCDEIHQNANANTNKNKGLQIVCDLAKFKIFSSYTLTGGDIRKCLTTLKNLGHRGPFRSFE